MGCATLPEILQEQSSQRHARPSPHSQHSPVAVSTRSSSAHCWHRRPPGVESWTHAPAMQPSGLQRVIPQRRGGGEQSSLCGQRGALQLLTSLCCCAKLTRTGSAAVFVRVWLLQHLRMIEAMRPQQCCTGYASQGPHQPNHPGQTRAFAAHLSTAWVC